MTNLRTCNRCGWVYSGVSFEYAEAEVSKFNKYYNSLSVKEQKDYYNSSPSSLLSYLNCHCGNTFRNFRLSKQGDCPTGCTINPIIYEPGVPNVKLTNKKRKSIRK